MPSVIVCAILACANAGCSATDDALELYPAACRGDWYRDAVLTGITENTYDDARRVVMTESQDPEGVPNWRFVWAYDDAGNLEREDVDEYADDTIDRRKTYRHNDQGNITREEWDDGGADPIDGIADYRVMNMYDETGELLLVSSVDNEADGIGDVTIINTYNEAGLIKTQEHVTVSSVRLTTYFYDDRDRLSMEEWDNDSDGTVDSRSTRFYDDADNWILFEMDSFADGSVDNRQVFTYDADNHRLSWEWDLDADGTSDWTWRYGHDENGHLALFERDGAEQLTQGGADGVADYRERFLNDAVGNVVVAEFDEDADGAAEYEIRYSYDCF